MFEMLQLPFMVNAIIGTSLLIILLAYFGIHVVKRCIIFIDLALAQIASLGVTIAVLFHLDSILMSVIFTLLGAIIFFIIDYENPKVPLEAIIGIFYVGASAASILVLSKASHSDEDILHMLFGNVLAITTQQIIEIILALAVLGLVHYLFRKKFLSLSFESGDNRKSIWNLLFYITLAISIAIAIKSAGVLLVFSYLVIPAVVALFLTENRLLMIGIAFAFGLIVNFSGIYASFEFDFPTGSCVIVFMTTGLFLCMLVTKAIQKFIKAKSQ